VKQHGSSISTWPCAINVRLKTLQLLPQHERRRDAGSGIADRQISIAPLVNPAYTRRVIPAPRLVRSDAGTLAVREWPNSGGVPLVFWHALGPCASGAELVELAPRFAAGGLAPVSVDGPGFGASPPSVTYDLESLATLLRATIRELGLDRPVLMGHSWGGAVVTTLAALHPDESRGLVLVDSGHIDYADLDGARNSAPPMQWEWESRAAFTGWLEENLDRPTPEILAGYGAGVLDHDGKVVGSSADSMLRAREGLLDRLSVRWTALAGLPVLLLLATQAPHVDQNREHLPTFRAAVPHADVRWVDGASHSVIADAGPPLGDTIAEWVTSAS
jgi:pimeloyl-ACP methyl ester carboxylesterase